MDSRSLFALPLSELLHYQVWEFDLENEANDGNDTWIKPVTELPVTGLGNRIVACELTLANGSEIIGIIGNVSLDNLRSTREFITISVLKNGEWFHLARYFDVTYNSEGSDALAAFLNMEVDDVFPISYDISSCAVGLETVTKGQIFAQPIEMFSEEERMALIFEQ